MVWTRWTGPRRRVADAGGRVGRLGGWPAPVRGHQRGRHGGQLEPLPDPQRTAPRSSTSTGWFCGGQDAGCPQRTLVLHRIGPLVHKAARCKPVHMAGPFAARSGWSGPIRRPKPRCLSMVPRSNQLVVRTVLPYRPEASVPGQGSMGDRWPGPGVQVVSRLNRAGSTRGSVETPTRPCSLMLEPSRVPTQARRGIPSARLRSSRMGEAGKAPPRTAASRLGCL